MPNNTHPRNTGNKRTQVKLAIPSDLKTKAKKVMHARALLKSKTESPTPITPSTEPVREPSKVIMPKKILIERILYKYFLVTEKVKLDTLPNYSQNIEKLLISKHDIKAMLEWILSRNNPLKNAPVGRQAKKQSFAHDIIDGTCHVYKGCAPIKCTLACSPASFQHAASQDVNINQRLYLIEDNLSIDLQQVLMNF